MYKLKKNQKKKKSWNFVKLVSKVFFFNVCEFCPIKVIIYLFAALLLGIA